MNKIDFDYVALIQALVKCPSVTPYDEGALQVVGDHLKDLGFECTRLPFSEDGFNDIDNLFAKIGETGKHLAFAGHTDVVPPGNDKSWKYSNFIENKYFKFDRDQIFNILSKFKKKFPRKY